MKIRNGRSWIVLSLALAVAACGGGGGDGGGSGTVVGGGGSSSLAASFTASQPSPGPDSVSLAEQGANGSTVTVRVNLTDVNGVYGALFDLTYPSNVADYAGYAAGTALEQGGQSVSYIIDEPTPGRLVVSVSRLGPVPGTDVSGTRALVDLIFQADNAGSGSVDFANMALVDANAQDLAVAAWDGGSLAAN
jgi:hypothetical protein